MRISDWSSDVCSSDLAAAPPPEGSRRGPLTRAERQPAQADRRYRRQGHRHAELPRRRHHRVPLREWRILLHRDEHPPAGDRKSVVEGESVSVRVDLGGRRIIKKKNNNTNKRMQRVE